MEAKNLINDKMSAPINLRGLKEMIPTLPKVEILKKDGKIYCEIADLFWTDNNNHNFIGVGENKSEAISNLYLSIKNIKPEAIE